jgi:hypothetical protein
VSEEVLFHFGELREKSFPKVGESLRDSKIPVTE